MYTQNKEVAAAIGFAGNPRKLARELEANPSTVINHVRRGFFSFELAKRAADRFGLDLEKLQMPPDEPAER